MLLSGVITHTHYIILGDMLNVSVWGDHPYTLHYIRRHAECSCLGGSPIHTTLCWELCWIPLSGVIFHSYYSMICDMFNVPVSVDACTP